MSLKIEIQPESDLELVICRLLGAFTKVGLFAQINLKN